MQSKDTTRISKLLGKETKIEGKSNQDFEWLPHNRKISYQFSL